MGMVQRRRWVKGDDDIKGKACRLRVASLCWGLRAGVSGGEGERGEKEWQS